VHAPWHDEAIVAMAPPKAAIHCWCSTVMRETLSFVNQSRVSWTGDLLCLSSSLRPEVRPWAWPDIGGVTRYALSALLQVCLRQSKRVAGVSCCCCWISYVTC
jgi:hypothetical protein